MALKKKPVTGMKDMLPREMEIRDYLIGLIKETYKTYGFCSIETPCVEHIENLCSKQGGDNEKLIFKILKRGEKLKIDTAKEENDLVDGGLRYDLTVPLARYYANHSNELPAPFKALQIGNVWRADRPQKGRFRQFMQCDIDILGEPGNLAEIELILATTAMLGKLSFQNFTVCINDRNILKAMAAYSGFREDDYDEVFIILDKMDKIGAEGVAKELEEMGMFAPEYKQPIPAYVKKIGVVTAPTGAAVQDIKNIALRRNPFVQIILYPALVQGEGAADSIVEGIRRLDALNLDVLIVGRGGGSIEDLWAFNEEKVARAVFSCHTPVISAVGHETDTTIIDFVADLRAPTPSAAAELAVADVRAVLNTLENYKSRMNHAMANQTQRARSRLLQYETKWKYLGPENKIRDQRARHAELERRYTDAMEEKLKEARHRLALYIQAMKGLSPLDKLNQGYSYVEKEGKAITSVQDVKEGDLLEICVSDGKITARAEKTSAVSWMEQS